MWDQADVGKNYSIHCKKYPVDKSNGRYMCEQRARTLYENLLSFSQLLIRVRTTTRCLTMMIAQANTSLASWRTRFSVCRFVLLTRKNITRLLSFLTRIYLKWSCGDAKSTDSISPNDFQLYYVSVVIFLTNAVFYITFVLKVKLRNL